jgi:anti-sigma regulatory factor (Ser/Thr protein kinase)
MNKKNEKTTEIRAFILAQIEKHPADLTGVTSDKFKISKQAVRKHMQALVLDGSITATGATRDRQYQLNLLAELKIEVPINSNISEDVIWRQDIRPKLQDVNPNIIGICQYGFTEMVNNVLDHSEGKNLLIYLRRTAAYLEILISDDGIGIFNKITKILGLNDKIHVVLEIAKGKLTTDPQRHTGEGIFFTSRVFDNFMIISGNLVFAHTEIDNDWLLEEKENLHEGTLVRLRINPESRRNLKDVFDKYSDGEEYGFSKTHIPVTLARYGDENLVSRSQAKRLLSRFERFKEVVLDFSGVEIVGQAFADELFRVFRNNHPLVHISYLNASDQVEKMILRAVSSS